MALIPDAQRLMNVLFPYDTAVNGYATVSYRQPPQAM